MRRLGASGGMTVASGDVAAPTLFCEARAGFGGARVNNHSCGRSHYSYSRAIAGLGEKYGCDGAQSVDALYPLPHSDASLRS